MSLIIWHVICWVTSNKMTSWVLHHLTVFWSEWEWKKKLKQAYNYYILILFTAGRGLEAVTNAYGDVLNVHRNGIHLIKTFFRFCDWRWKSFLIESHRIRFNKKQHGTGRFGSQITVKQNSQINNEQFICTLCSGLHLTWGLSAWKPSATASITHGHTTHTHHHQHQQWELARMSLIQSTRWLCSSQRAVTPCYPVHPNHRPLLWVEYIRCLLGWLGHCS